MMYRNAAEVLRTPVRMATTAMVSQSSGYSVMFLACVFPSVIKTPLSNFDSKAFFYHCGYKTTLTTVCARPSFC